MVDAVKKQIIYVNPAYETITGRPLATLRDNPTSYQETFHPEDRVRILTKLEEASQTGQLDEEFRIVRPDRVVRWVSVRGFAVRDSTGVVRRLVGISQDITARKSAQEQMAKNLGLAECAWAEADAFRKTTLALTQDLRMDRVLDTLLESVVKLIPCEFARILLVETDTRLFLEREIQHTETSRGAELEQRLADLERAEHALQQAEESRTLSEDKFMKVFNSSPIAFSVTTVGEGRFIDVNEAFEIRYGYLRKDLLGRTVFDIGIWDNPSERHQMLEEVGRRGRVRNRITRFRIRTGKLVETIYSADTIELEGEECLLAVSQDVVDRTNIQISLGHKAAAK